jgi:glycosyltransferase involved in cell wall biosynthesis
MCVSKDVFGIDEIVSNIPVNTVCHMVTGSIDPAMGGLAETVDRIARQLATIKTVHAVVYSLESAGRGGNVLPYSIEDLSSERQHFTAPLSNTDGALTPTKLRRLSPEGYQINRLLLLARMKAHIEERPSDRHVVISFFMTTVGFTSQLIAQELGLPHVAFVAGSDVNRDVASPTGMAAAGFVATHADWIVAGNRDHMVRVQRLFGRADRISVSYGALPAGRPRAYWERGARDHVSLVSDCGYSFKKSTHSLVDAFDRLRKDGEPVRLTIVGRTEPDQREYWESAKRKWCDQFGHTVSLSDHVPKDSIEPLLLSNDIYCSASLGEGSSNGALFALALGIPIVAPQISSLADLTDSNLDRTLLFRAGDRRDLERCLAEMVKRVKRDSQPINRLRVDALRRKLWETEAQDWQHAISAALGVTG